MLRVEAEGLQQSSPAEDSRVAGLQADIHRLTTQLQEQNVELDRVKTEHTESKAKEIEYLKEIETLKQKFVDADVMNEISLLRHQLSEKEVEVQKVSAELQSLKPQVEEGQLLVDKEKQWQVEIQDLQARLTLSESEASKEIQNLKEKINEQAEDIERLNASLQEQRIAEVTGHVTRDEQVVQPLVASALASGLAIDDLQINKEVVEEVVQQSQTTLQSAVPGMGDTSLNDQIEELKVQLQAKNEEVVKLQERQVEYSPFSTGAGTLHLKEKRIEELESVLEIKAKEIKELQQQVSVEGEYSPFSTGAGHHIQLKEKRIKELEEVVEQQVGEITRLREHIHVHGKTNSAASDLQEQPSETLAQHTSGTLVDSQSCYSPACVRTVNRLENELRKALETIRDLRLQPGEADSLSKVSP